MIKFGENEKSSNKDDIQHWITHFDIERSRKDLWLDNGDIEEVEEKSNLKMQRFLCEDCFLKVLNESPTLGRLFFMKQFDSFIY